MEPQSTRHLRPGSLRYGMNNRPLPSAGNIHDGLVWKLLTPSLQLLFDSLVCVAIAVCHDLVAEKLTARFG